MTKQQQAVLMANHLAANIENPADLSRASRVYMPTRQSLEFVNQLANLAEHGGSAHSLQGAYGAGKSSLAIFAMHQLASKTKIFTPHRNLKTSYKLDLSAKRIQKLGGMLAVPVMGSAAPLAQRISVGLRNAADNYIGRRPKALRWFKKTNPQLVTSEQLQQSLEDLINDERVSSSGTLLIIDEFGRQFEHMLSTGNLVDLHLLQNLAEMPGKGKSPFTIIIVQHHGLEHYTSRFISQQHAEWEKVRGRFKEFLLANTETDTANIVSTLIHHDGRRLKQRTAANKTLKHKSKIAKLLDDDFIEAASKCGQLHPMTIYILARLSRLLGQGDRTVVGWLSSHLDTGFQAAAKNTNGWLYPHSLFNHFFGDIQNLPTNPAIAKRFNAVHSAFSRYGTEEQSLTSQVLQTIGLLYFCRGAGLKADLDTIRCSLPNVNNLVESIKTLAGKSLITYRRHSDEYRVWEGSDYDIQTKLSDVIQKVDFSPAEALERFVSKRALAHRHFIETGNHRSAKITWIDRQRQISAPSKKHEPCIFVWLDKTPKISHAGLNNCVWGVMNINSIADQLQEAAALAYMLENDIELQQDIVASGEIQEQLAYLESKIGSTVNFKINSEVGWRLGSKKQGNLQLAISGMMDQIYNKSFRLHNEMLNREKTSGQATLAVRLLIEAMVQNSALPQFGIDKFPAERLLYESLFRKMGMHKGKGLKDWQLTLKPEHIDQQIVPVMKQITHMGQIGLNSGPCSIDKIVNELGKPPFGVKPMPVLLLCCIFIFVNKEHVELYEDGEFLPSWRSQTLTRLIKAPGSFGIRIPESVKYSDSLLEEYRQALLGTAKTKEKATPLNIAKGVLVHYSSLSEYARKTKSLSSKSREFRRSILSARSPADMLFEMFPKAAGIHPFPRQVKKRRALLNKLGRLFLELEQAEKKLVNSFEKILLQSYSSKKLATARNKIVADAAQVESLSNMHYAHGKFLQAIQDSSYVEPILWLRNLLDKGLDILTPLNSWSDDEVAQAEFHFRTRLIWLRQAVSALDDRNSQKNSKIMATEKKHNRKTSISKQLLAINKQLGSLPQEEVIPLLLELLYGHSGAHK